MAGGQHIWLFFGEMGSGKTTLIRSICAMAGVVQNVTSPTFSLINEYETVHGKKIYHFDLFRLTTEKEVFEIDTTKYFDTDGLCFVEWPDRLGELMPMHYFRIQLTGVDLYKRKIEYQHI